MDSYLAGTLTGGHNTLDKASLLQYEHSMTLYSKLLASPLITPIILPYITPPLRSIDRSPYNPSIGAPTGSNYQPRSVLDLNTPHPKQPYPWLAGDEGMEKNMEATIMRYIGTTTRILSFIPSQPEVRSPIKDASSCFGGPCFASPSS